MFFLEGWNYRFKILLLPITTRAKLRPGLNLFEKLVKIPYPNGRFPKNMDMSNESSFYSGANYDILVFFQSLVRFSSKHLRWSVLQGSEYVSVIIIIIIIIIIVIIIII